MGHAFKAFIAAKKQQRERERLRFRSDWKEHGLRAAWARPGSRDGSRTVHGLGLMRDPGHAHGSARLGPGTWPGS